MHKTVLCLAVAVIAITLTFASCKHRLDVYTHTPDEPIVVKLEVHIYQHAVQDVGFITGELPDEEGESATPPVEETEESIPPAPESKAGNVLLQLLGIGAAHAETVSDNDQLKLVLNSMRKRYPTLKKYKADKSVGENRRGFVVERPSPKMSDAKYAAAVRATISAENANRRLLYQIRARMDRTTPEKQAIAYAKAWRNGAKPGEWIEVVVNKKWVWKQK